MINSLLRNSFLFVVLILVQILILDNLQLSSYAVPFLYVLFILMLPFATPGMGTFISGFFYGFYC